MTKEDIFYKIAKHLIAQKAPALNENGSGVCMYRTGKGLKCAAGCLIEDKHYTRHIEHKPIISPFFQDALRLSIGRNLTDEEEKMVMALQNLHDISLARFSNHALPVIFTGLDLIAGQFGIFRAGLADLYRQQTSNGQVLN